MGIWASLGYQQITSLSGAAALTVPTGTKFCVVQTETKDVRWRDDGVDPTASVGMLVPAGLSILLEGNLPNLRFIETAASAKLNVSYYA